MLGIRRRPLRTRTQQIGEHLREAATLAAESAAERVGPRYVAARDAVGPRLAAVRGKATHGWESTMEAVAPIMAAAVEGAHRATAQAQMKADKAQKGAKHMGRKADKARTEASRRVQGAALALRGESPKAARRWPLMIGMLAVGAVVGVAGALVARRRAPQWEEFETRALDTAADKVTTGLEAAKGKARQVGETVKQTADKAADAVAEAAGKARPKVKSAAEAATEKTERSADEIAGEFDDIVARANANARRNS